MPTTWVVIANGSVRRIFEHRAHQREFELKHEQFHVQSRQKSEEVLSDPKRARAIIGQDSKDILKKEEQRHFAHQTAIFLDESRKQNEFQNLILVASPSFLGMIKEHLPTQTRKHIVRNLHKDYTTLTHQETQEELHYLMRHHDKYGNTRHGERTHNMLSSLD